MKTISYLKILVPTAGPVPARERAKDITRIANSLNAELIIMHIITPEHMNDEKRRSEGEEALDIFSNSAENLGIKTSKVLHEGELVPSIIEYSETNNIDLIVMGASEDQIVAEWIISDLKEHSKVPVVVVPYGFSSLI
ncbi:MAG: universal stress protein [Thermoplasmata archaeon]|nr:MAG: universal stress protein [Thermoplasmata archaeon]